MSTTHKTDQVGRLLLQWLEAHAQEQPNPDDFLDDAPEIDGVPITVDELEKAVVRAEHHGMLRGAKVAEREMPLRVRLLPPGQECLDDHDGSMRRWTQAQRGSSTVHTDNSVSITAGDNVQVVAHAQRAVQNMSLSTIDPERLRDVGTAAQEIIEVLPAPIRDDVTQAGKELVRAAEDPDDVDTARSAGQRLLDLLTASSASLVVVRFIIDALTGALGG